MEIICPYLSRPAGANKKDFKVRKNTKNLVSLRIEVAEIFVQLLIVWDAVMSYPIMSQGNRTSPYTQA